MLKQLINRQFRCRKQNIFEANISPVIVLTALMSVGGGVSAADIEQVVGDDELAEVVVRATRVANVRPAGSYASIATALRFDPQTELQSRGLAEGQSDVTARGGVFENTGFVVGAATIFDPQTGHYAAGLPIDPALLTAPNIRTGVDNSILGFNSNVASVEYGLPVITSGGDVVLGFGDNSLWFSSLRHATVKELKSGNDLGVSASVAWSQGNGTLPNGDHEFARYNFLVQHSEENARTDLLLSYQDKFYAWPGAYTGFASLAETDHTKTQFALLNHRRDLSNGWFELSGYYRELEDDYDFDRTTQESGTPGSFEHATRAYAVGFQGSFLSGEIDWRYGGQFTADKLLWSTDLTEGDFTSRNYAKLSLVPSFNLKQSGNKTMSARLGISLDTSNRDSSAISPVAAFTIEQAKSFGRLFYEAEYASASQLPGYTALNSRPSGLFGGNADLGREKAQQLSFSVRGESQNWSGASTLFFRKDDDLVDWTYNTNRPFSRQANAVDLDVWGLEIFVRRQWSSLGIVAAYTYLDKESDYGSTQVDASFYALNFARHRVTLAILWQLSSQLELQMDNEYRQQEDNPLRSSESNAFLSSLTLAWDVANIPALGVSLTVDNLTDSDYQFFPGTPAVGRQLSLSAHYRW